MATDFTVIIRVRQRFGDSHGDDVGQETDAPFVGIEKSFPFACPNVDRNADAFLLFQGQGANIPHSMEINGQTVFGGIPRSVGFIPLPPSGAAIAQWAGNVMIVNPGVLQTNNVLHIASSTIGDTDDVDNFVIDNVVIVFKTHGIVVRGPRTRSRR